MWRQPNKGLLCQLFTGGGTQSHQSAGDGMPKPVSGPHSNPQMPQRSLHMSLLQGRCVERSNLSVAIRCVAFSWVAQLCSAMALYWLCNTVQNMDPSNLRSFSLSALVTVPPTSKPTYALTSSSHVPLSLCVILSASSSFLCIVLLLLSHCLIPHREPPSSPESPKFLIEAPGLLITRYQEVHFMFSNSFCEFSLGGLSGAHHSLHLFLVSSYCNLHLFFTSHHFSPHLVLVGIHLF
jgi:hypothetical protein